MELEKSYQDLFQEVKTVIEDEEDPELRTSLLTTLANILSRTKNENEGVEKLKDFLANILENNTEED